MKILPMLLLNLVLVGGALVVYDRMRSEPAPATIAMEGDADTADFEQRLRVLEVRRRPVLQSAGTDPRLVERLEAVEAALAARVMTDDRPGDGGDRAGGAPSQDAAQPSLASADEPTANEIRRFRRLAEAVRREVGIEKNAARVDKAVDKLSLNLSRRQRRKVAEAFTTFQPRINQIWGEAKNRARQTAKEGGAVNRAEIVETTTALIQQEFVATINDTVSSADAESIARALLAGGK